MLDIFIKIFGYKILYINSDLVAIERYKWILSIIQKKNYKKLIDLGCGNCILSFSILQKKIANEVFSVSFDKNNNEKSMKRSKLLNYKNHHIHYSDFNNSIEINKNSNLDCAISLETIEHIENDNNFLMNIHKILKKNGELYLSFPYPKFKSIIKSDYELSKKRGAHVRHGYTEKEILQILNKTGFKVLEIEYLTSNNIFFISQVFRLLKIKNLDFIEKLLRIPMLFLFYFFHLGKKNSKGNYLGIRAIKIG